MALAVNALKEQIEKAKENLKNVDDSIKKVTGRDPNEARPERAVVERGRGRGRGQVLGRRPWNDQVNDEPPTKKPPNVFQRVGTIQSRRVVVGSRRYSNKSPQESDEWEDEDEKKPTIQSSIVSTAKTITKKELIHAQNPDEKGKARNRRMFGMLLGTLARFQSDESKADLAAKQEQKRTEIDRRLEQVAASERRQAAAERRELYTARRAQQKRIELLEQKIELAGEQEIWEKYWLQKSKFVITKASPPIFFMPKDSGTGRILRAIKETQKVIQDKIDTSRDSLQTSLAEIDMEIANLDSRKDSNKDEVPTEGGKGVETGGNDEVADLTEEPNVDINIDGEDKVGADGVSNGKLEGVGDVDMKNGGESGVEEGGSPMEEESGKVESGGESEGEEQNPPDVQDDEEQPEVKMEDEESSEVKEDNLPQQTLPSEKESDQTLHNDDDLPDPDQNLPQPDVDLPDHDSVHAEDKPEPQLIQEEQESDKQNEDVASHAVNEEADPSVPADHDGNESDSHEMTTDANNPEKSQDNEEETAGVSEEGKEGDAKDVEHEDAGVTNETKDEPMNEDDEQEEEEEGPAIVPPTSQPKSTESKSSSRRVSSKDEERSRKTSDRSKDRRDSRGSPIRRRNSTSHRRKRSPSPRRRRSPPRRSRRSPPRSGRSTRQESSRHRRKSSSSDSSSDDNAPRKRKRTPPRRRGRSSSSSSSSSGSSSSSDESPRRSRKSDPRRDSRSSRYRR